MRFIQMWIMPNESGSTPGVEQKVFTKADRTDRLLKTMSGRAATRSRPSGRERLRLASDARRTVEHAFEPGQGAYLYVIEGGSA